MPSADDLRALLERVTAASGPDRDLDYAIYGAFVPDKLDDAWFWLSPRTYTASIDAALPLADRTKPPDLDTIVLFSDALDRMGREGFRPDLDLTAQVARYVLIEPFDALITREAPMRLTSNASARRWRTASRQPFPICRMRSEP